MGTKRRSMFNPKFKNVRSERWNQGRRILGIPTEEELEAKRSIEQHAEEVRLKAEEEAKVKLQAAEEARHKMEQETKVKFARAEEARIRTEEAQKVKLTPEIKTKSRPKTKTARMRRTRAKKE